MKQYRNMSWAFIFLCAAFISLSAGEARAEVDAESFPSEILYIPCYHSRPVFIKDFRPEQVSPVKKVSINEPNIAEVKVITPYELVVDARHPGSTMFIVWYEDNSVDFFEVRVTAAKVYTEYQVEVIKGVISSKDQK